MVDISMSKQRNKLVTAVKCMFCVPNDLKLVPLVHMSHSIW